MRKLLITFVIVFLLVSQAKAQVEPLLLYKVQQDDACKEWVDKTMSAMSLKEKVGQLFIYTVAPQNTKKNLNLLRDAVRTHNVGGLLFSGGKLGDQALLTNYAQTNADIPLMITFDGEWGLAMRLKGTPKFPKNMVLGCIQDDKLIYEYGKEMARECKELGVHVNFAPVTDINVNPANPVINVRSFGEDPHLVADKVIAYASGLESEGVLSVCKHFPGHGDTDVDSHKALPMLPFTRARLDSVELYPFKQAIRAGLGGIMVGHLQVPALDDSPFPSSLSGNVISGLLVDELKFKGLIFTDALAMKGVSSNEKLCVRALKAGNDMVLTPRNIKVEIQEIMDALDDGTLTEEMINKKCHKVLMYKYALGVHRRQKINLSGLEERICTPEAEELVRKLHLASITVLGNHKRVLPLHSSLLDLTVISIGKQKSDTVFIQELSKFTSISHYRLSKEMNDSVRHDILDKVADSRRVIVSITTSDMKEYEAFLASVSLNAPAIYTIFTPFGSLDQIPASLSSASAVVLGHSDNEDVQTHVADVLFGKASADGRLSAGIPGLFRIGEGVSITPATPHYYLPEELGMNSAVLSRVDSIVTDAIQSGAFPGCRVYVLKNGSPVYDKCFGNFTYEKDAHKVQLEDLYDLASLSKTTGTLFAIMKLYDKGRFGLTDKVSAYLSYLKGTNKENITISELLFHQSGLPASIAFYKDAIDEKSYKAPFYRNKRDKTHQTQVGKNTFVPSGFSFKESLVSKHPSEIYDIHVADSFWLNRSFREHERQMIVDAPIKNKKYVYSCVNFILLKELVEHISGESMDKFLEREFWKPMHLKSLTYLPLNKFAKDWIAPTVKDDFLRREAETLQGYVHDESAAFFGGVSGNAGLFGSASDVAAVYQLLLNGGEYEGKRYLSSQTCNLFTTLTSKISRRGLGFDKPDSKDLHRSPCSASAPATVFGHTGFTGTCAWADPDNKMIYIFLSNRTYPNVWNGKLSDMNIRPKIQKTLYEAINAYSK